MTVYEKSIIIKEAIARIIPTVKHGEIAKYIGESTSFLVRQWIKFGSWKVENISSRRGVGNILNIL